MKDLLDNIMNDLAATDKKLFGSRIYIKAPGVKISFSVEKVPATNQEWAELFKELARCYEATDQPDHELFPSKL